MDKSTGKLGSGLFYRSWPAADQASAVVLISHGLGEHSGRYEHVAAAFNAAGLHVYALDHLGHGQSPGKRAFVSRFSELTDGVAELRAHIAHEYPSMPVYLVGHSLGGLIAASTVLGAAHDYAGLLMTGPALGVPTPPPAWQVLLLRVFSAVAPDSKRSNSTLTLSAETLPLSKTTSRIRLFITRTSLREWSCRCLMRARGLWPARKTSACPCCYSTGRKISLRPLQPPLSLLTCLPRATSSARSMTACITNCLTNRSRKRFSKPAASG